MRRRHPCKWAGRFSSTRAAHGTARCLHPAAKSSGARAPAGPAAAVVPVEAQAVEARAVAGRGRSARIGPPGSFSLQVDVALQLALMKQLAPPPLHEVSQSTRPQDLPLSGDCVSGSPVSERWADVVNDVGTRISLWVSAFEVLLHPGGAKNVNKSVVQSHLAQVPWPSLSMRSQRYVVKYQDQATRATLGESCTTSCTRLTTSSLTETEWPALPFSGGT